MLAAKMTWRGWSSSACEALGGIDVLINNAGIAWREPFLEITPSHWDRMITVNLRGMFLVAQAVARVLVDQGGGGVIVNMSSTNGLGGEADYAHYNASKGGVLLLTKTMAVELGPYGIRVNALCPGFIETPLNAAISADLGGKDSPTRTPRPHPAGPRAAGHPRWPRRTRSWPRTTRPSSPAPGSSSTAGSSRSCDPGTRGLVTQPRRTVSRAWIRARDTVGLLAFSNDARSWT